MPTHPRKACIVEQASRAGTYRTLVKEFPDQQRKSLIPEPPIRFNDRGEEGVYQ